MIDDLPKYERLQDSGILWLGKIPAHLELRRAKTIFVKQNRPPRAEDEVVTCFRDGQVTLRKNRRTSGFTVSLKEIGYQGIRKGDLVIHYMDAFAGAVGVSDADGKGSPIYSVCTPKENYNTEFAAFLVRQMATRGWIEALATGIRQRSTDFRYSTFGHQILPIPPPEEQKSIVKFLHHANRKINSYITAKQKLIQLLKEQKKVIVSQAVTKGLDFNVPMEDSKTLGWGMVPKHWKQFRMGQLVSKKSIVNCPEKELLSVFLDRGVIRFSDVETKRPNATSTDLSSYQLVQPGDFVLNNQQAWRGSVGVSGFEGIVSPAYFVLDLSDRLTAAYANYLFRSVVMVDQYRVCSRGVGSMQRDLYWPDFRTILVFVPPAEEQESVVTHINNKTSKLHTVMEQSKKEIDLLKELQTRLISDVVTGKLDVRRAASKVPNCTPNSVHSAGHEQE